MQAAHKVVKVVNLGRMNYLLAHDIQNYYASRHLKKIGHGHECGADNILLLVEHNPVYTIGVRRGQYDHKDEARLKSLGAEFYYTNRGGLITYHGPGQLVAYPILNLKCFKPSMLWYVRSLESTIIRTCAEFGVNAVRTSDTGVWVNGSKIAALGVHGSRYVTTHGVSINCDLDLSWYKHIVPCGLDGKEMTSLSKEVQKDITIYDVMKPFIENFAKEFDCDVEDTMLEDKDREMLFRKHGVNSE